MVSSVESDFAAWILLAWQRRMSFTDLLNTASTLEARGQRPFSVVLYQTWLARNQTEYNHFGYFNLGVSLFNEGDTAAACEAYRHAITLQPGFAQPRFNLGLAYERLGQQEAAIAEWAWIAENVSPEHADNRQLLITALNNLGRLLEIRSRYAEALAYLDKSLALNPTQPDTIHHWVYLREKQCAWPVYVDVPGLSPDLMRDSTSALAMLSLSDDPQAQLLAARQFVKHKIMSDVPRLSPASAYGHKKIRIAYCSSDFCLHPVSMLTAELFELHDRNAFEVYGFCWSREDNSAMRRRVISAMDQFIRIHELTDEAAAHLIRDHEIDILVDLQGQTLGARANMLAYRPAPIQITYLGLPATTGLPSIDYVIADRFLIPEDAAQFYSEKPIYMPDVYQVSDRKRPSSPPPTRASCNLPEDAFVFCSFNNNFKYTPEVFTAWMNILRRTPGSVLWLLADNPWAQENLQKEAQAHGIDIRRLIFATRVAPENYLARYAVADLFLDSFPFNAGTTANDALWMGLPVLTCSGRSFASRMAGALLTAAGMDELITYSLHDYEEKAVSLATKPQACVSLRNHLKAVRENGVLFDTPRFVRNLEERLKQLVADLPSVR